MLLPPLLYHPDFSLCDDEPVYDSSRHLDLTEPDFVVLLDGFRQVARASPLKQSSNGVSQLAYTGPFRLLSDEGYQVLCSIIKRELVHQKSDPRQPNFIRHIGYRSKWIQDFNRCPKVLDHLSKITGDVQLVPSALQSNYSHVNIGLPTTDDTINVDAWHCDSVPYVLIILACDMTNTVGGELQLIEREPSVAFDLIKNYKGKVPQELTRPIDYLGSNSCVFMQGSRLAHRVTGVQSCTEPRLTVVNSFMSDDPFASDCTKYDTFKTEITGDFEFTVHKLWRAQRQILDGATHNQNKTNWPTKDELIQRIQSAINELKQCRNLLQGTMSDAIGFYDEKKQTMSSYEIKNNN